MPEFPRLNVQLQRAEAHALDLFDVMSNLLEHPANLSVASFDQRDFVPRIGGLAQQFNPYRCCLDCRGAPFRSGLRQPAGWRLQRRTVGGKLYAAPQLLDLI